MPTECGNSCKRCPAGYENRATCTGGQTNCSCVPTTFSCSATPQCSSGDEELASSSSCPRGATCYSQTTCDKTIYCASLPKSVVWPADATLLVAIDEGGGFVPTPPVGSKCKMGEAEYTLATDTNQLSYKICKTDVAPYVYASGARMLSVSAAQSIKAAAAKMTLSAATTCGDDKSQRLVRITSPSMGTREYLDSFYACNGAGTYVEDIDAVFGAMQVALQ